jgi:putative SOS response-associated peptidase YedK
MFSEPVPEILTAQELAQRLIEEHFDAISGEEYWSPRYNVAPTQAVPVIRQHPKEPVRELSLM